jgi:hypothetical protein
LEIHAESVIVPLPNEEPVDEYEIPEDVKEEFRKIEKPITDPALSKVG